LFLKALAPRKLDRGSVLPLSEKKSVVTSKLVYLKIRKFAVWQAIPDPQDLKTITDCFLSVTFRPRANVTPLNP